MELNKFEVFEGKSLSDLFEEIYNNSVEKRLKIISLIEDMKPFVKDIADAVQLVPVIKDYMDVSVKNDENLLKLATIIQRIIARETVGDGDEFGISEAEKRQLMSEAQTFYDSVTSAVAEVSGSGIDELTKIKKDS